MLGGWPRPVNSKEVDGYLQQAAEHPDPVTPEIFEDYELAMLVASPDVSDGVLEAIEAFMGLHGRPALAMKREDGGPCWFIHAPLVLDVASELKLDLAFGRCPPLSLVHLRNTAP